MDTEFWHQRWSENRIGFHEGRANTLLVAHFDQLALVKNDRVFVPLCGKTRDIEWFLSKGLRVVGVELSELAIEQLFSDLALEPVVCQKGSFTYYSAENIDIFVGDFFKLNQALIGDIDAIFDRAALVALPENMRIDYTKHLKDITNNAPQLLITFIYDQTLMSGPPFSISSDEVNHQYANSYDVHHLENITLDERFNNVPDVNESVWFLKPLIRD